MVQIDAPVNSSPDRKARLATVWLGGCSGCHMSFLDLDERLIELADKVIIVYSPVVDIKIFPENVDATLVEGAVCNNEHLHLAKQIRERSKIVVSFGDCAVNGNITAMRNPLGKLEPVLQRAYVENTTFQPQIPSDHTVIPQLLEKVQPLHEVIKVDAFLPGCPPSADLIYFVVTELLAGRTPDLSDKLKFG